MLTKQDSEALDKLKRLLDNYKPGELPQSLLLDWDQVKAIDKILDRGFKINET